MPAQDKDSTRSSSTRSSKGYPTKAYGVEPSSSFLARPNNVELAFQNHTNLFSYFPMPAMSFEPPVDPD